MSREDNSIDTGPIEGVGIYPISSGIEIAEIAANFGEEMNGMKSFGLQNDRKIRLSRLHERMKKYPEVFEPFVKAYVKNDNMVRDYGTMLNGIFSDFDLDL